MFAAQMGEMRLEGFGKRLDSAKRVPKTPRNNAKIILNIIRAALKRY
jgi:hypothetical protein